MNEKKLRTHIFVALGLAVITDLSILCVPCVKIDGTAAQRNSAYIVAGLFWICIILQIVNVCMTTKIRKQLQRKKLRGCKFEALPVGAFAFRQNVEGLVADALLVISFLALVFVSICKVRSVWLTIVLVAAVILLFQLHCIFNGRNYRAYKVYLFMNKGADRHEQK